MEARPQHLRRRVGVARAEDAAVDRLAHGRAQQAEGLRGRIADLVDVLEFLRRHEHEAVVVGVAEPETGVGLAELADALHGVGWRRLGLQDPQQLREVFAAKRLDEVVLVLEVVVDGVLQ